MADTGKYRNEPSGSIKWGGISCIAKNGLASQEGLSLLRGVSKEANKEPVTKMVDGRLLRWFGHQIRMESKRKPRNYGKQEFGTAVKRKAKDRMGRACVEGDEEKRRTLQEVTRLAKGRKALRIWLMQTDAWKGTRGKKPRCPLNRRPRGPQSRPGRFVE